MRKQIPHGPEDQICPYNGRACNEVCHKCPKWVQLRGMNPQDHTDQIDQWMCADAMTPVALLEIARQQRSNAAAIESLRNEMLKMDGQSQAMVGSLTTMLNHVLEQASSPQLLLPQQTNGAPKLIG